MLTGEVIFGEGWGKPAKGRRSFQEWYCYDGVFIDFERERHYREWSKQSTADLKGILWLLYMNLMNFLD